MPKAFRIEMMEVEGEKRRPDGYIYAKTKESIENKLEEAAKPDDKGIYALPLGKIVEVEVTDEFDEFLSLGNDEAYWTMIGKHKGDLTLGKL